MWILYFLWDLAGLFAASSAKMTDYLLEDELQFIRTIHMLFILFPTHVISATIQWDKTHVSMHVERDRLHLYVSATRDIMSSKGSECTL